MKTEIRISPLFFAVIAFLLVMQSDGTVTVALVSSIFHECGHLAVCLFFGSRIKSITLSFYGMKIIRQNELELSFFKEIAVSLAGVAVNFSVCIAFLVLYAVFPQQVFQKVAAVNFLLGFFNCLPVFSLDGGRAFLYFLNLRYPYEKSEKILKIISAVIIVPVFFFGIILSVCNRNFTLLICALYLAAGSF
jgi:stage IV sporulation protein FB